MNPKHPIVELIDQAIEADAATKHEPRSHLGGSVIGRECERELWYGFRWVKFDGEGFPGRMRRLFDRGHREEERFIGYLRRIGCEVREYSERLVYDTANQYRTLPWNQNLPEGYIDVSTNQLDILAAKEAGIELKQWQISDINGHYGGSLDGIALKVPTLDPDEEIILEFKTHNTKSFVALVNDGVKISKPVHWTQMQTYMGKMGLNFALYMAVNKNDDDLHCEIVEHEPLAAEAALEKASNIINASKPPNRINNASPSYFVCKQCTYRNPCHFGEPLSKNCRTCLNSQPVQNGDWYCHLWQNIIPPDFVPKGCDQYKAITD